MTDLPWSPTAIAPPTPLPRATQVRRAFDGPAADRIVLDYDGRFLRRKRLVTALGLGFLADLPETVSLDPGDALLLDDGRAIAVLPAPEPCLRIEGRDLPRLAWHIGNRHTPCQIAPDHLLIRADPGLEAMLRGLGAMLTPTMMPFTPEGGAYGHGRTMGHDHGPDPFAPRPVAGVNPSQPAAAIRPGGQPAKA